MYLSYAVHKLAQFSPNPGKLHFEGLVHLFIYTRDNNILGLKYYADINDAPLSDLFRKASINTENQFRNFSYSSWQDCPDTGISTGAYIIFYQGGPIDHRTHVSGSVAQPSAEIECNAACTAVMTLAHLRILIHELLNKDPDIVPEESPLIIFYSKSGVCIANNYKDTKNTKKIDRGVHFARNGENKTCTRLTDVKEVCNWQT